MPIASLKLLSIAIKIRRRPFVFERSEIFVGKNIYVSLKGELTEIIHNFGRPLILRRSTGFSKREFW